jgi:hypothetical protein
MSLKREQPIRIYGAAFGWLDPPPKNGGVQAKAPAFPA